MVVTIFFHNLLEHLHTRQVVTGNGLKLLLDRFCQGPSGLFNFFRLVPVHLTEFSQKGQKSYGPSPVPIRKICSTIERAALRCQPYCHGPATPPREGLHCSHVNSVNFRMLFPVNLDGYIVFVQILGDFLIFK